MTTSKLVIDPVSGTITRLTNEGESLGIAGWIEKSNGYRRFSWMNKKLYVHRVLWEYINGSIPQGMQIDHINGNKLDNRIVNLRLVTASQNAQNQIKPKKGTRSGFKGVDWDCMNKKWRAKITINRKTIHVGLFKSLWEAADAYAKAAAIYHTHNPDAAT